MATEKRLIDANDLEATFRETKMIAVFPNWRNMDILAKCAVVEYAKKVKNIVTNAPTVNAVVLPYPPRPMLKDRNPYNTDVYCPECGTNLSGYYGNEPLPIVTCFNCGEILDPYKTTTGTDGKRETE